MAEPGGSSREEGLRALLENHRPHDAREQAFLERMLALTRSERPFERDSFDPGHFTASAFILPPERDAFLLILHAKLGIWVQPGGHVESGDATVYAAARREVAEEVGLADVAPAHGMAPFDVDIHPIPARGSEPGHEHFDVRYLFVLSHRTFQRTDEVRDARWVPFAEMDHFSTDESVRRAARKAAGAR